MARIFFIIVAIVLFSCSSRGPDGIKNDRYMARVHFDGHDYIGRNVMFGGSFLHDPDCPCKAALQQK